MNKKVLIVIASYYKDISDGMLKNSLNFLNKKKFTIKKIFVPGVFEIPVIISKNIKKFDGFIALGCVIKGETPHFDYISRSTINALMDLSVNSKKPIGNGIITCLNKKQALKRSKKKGQEATKALISVFQNV